MLAAAMVANDNPFAPPQARVADSHEPVAPARKPIAVWLLQGLCVGVLVWTAGFLLIAFLGSTAWHHEDAIVALVLAGLWAALALCLGVIVRDCQKRERRGRRLGLFIIGLLLFYVLAWVVGDLAAPGARAGDHGGGAVAWLGLAGTLAWGWRFGFTPRARAWFVERQTSP